MNIASPLSHPLSLNQSTQKCVDEGGQSALFLLVLLPVTLLLGTFALDLTTYRAVEASLQSESDQLALEAARLASDPEKQAEYLRQIALRTPNSELRELRRNPADGAITVVLGAKVKPLFAAPLRAVTREELLFEAQRGAEAAPAPTDSLIIFVSGSSLRPGAVRSSSLAPPTLLAPWGDYEWRASRHFHRCPEENLPAQSKLASVEHSASWLTQACFNPALTPLKLGAIEVVDSLLSQPHSRVALVFTPGREGAAELASPLRFSPTSDLTKQYETPPLVERFSGVSDSLCLAIAESPSSNYPLPPNKLNQENNSPLRGLGCRSNNSLDPQYFAGQARIREQIYWRAPLLDESQSTLRRVADLSGALALAGEQFPDLPNNPPTGVLPRPRRIILFTDSLLSSSPASLHQILEVRKIQLTVVLFLHPYLSAHDRSETLKHLPAWRNQPRVSLLTAYSSDELLTTTVPQVVASGTVPLLRR